MGFERNKYGGSFPLYNFFLSGSLDMMSLPKFTDFFLVQNTVMESFSPTLEGARALRYI